MNEVNHFTVVARSDESDADRIGGRNIGFPPQSFGVKSPVVSRPFAQFNVFDSAGLDSSIVEIALCVSVKRRYIASKSFSIEEVVRLKN